MNFKHAVAGVALLLCSFISVFAHTGSIKMTVVDDKTGETLIGATVVIDGTTKGTITDFDGIANLTGVNAGTYNVRVSYISYQTTIVSDVTVEPGTPNVLTVHLNPADLEINEVIVTAKAAKNSENALLTLQKKSPKLFDAITSDQFSKIGVSDAAGALKKVTGVTIASGKYVFVRGLGDRYSKSVLNGSDVPSLDPNKNSVQLDLFPTNLIDNIIVYKTFTPDLPGDFTGGLVDITTKDFPSAFSLQFSLGLEFNPQANLNKDFLAPKGSKTDWLGYDNGFRSLPPEIAQYSASEFPDPYLNKDQITTVSRAFKNRQFQAGKASRFLNHSFSFSVGNQVKFFNKPLGFIVGLSYDRKYSNYMDGVQNSYEGISEGQTTLNRDVHTSATEHKSEDDVLMGAMLNTSYKFSANNKIGLSLMANQGGTNEARSQEGYLLDANPDSTTRLQNRAIAYTQRSFRNVQLRGEHVLPHFRKLKIKWSSSYTDSKIKEPDTRLIRNQYTINAQGDTLYYMGNLDRPSRFFRDLNESNSNSKLDFTLPANLFKAGEAKIKFGGMFTYKERSFRENIYQYSIQSDKNYDGNISIFFQDQNLGYVDNQLRNYLMNINIDGNNFDAYQRLGAAYLMLESPVAEKLNLTVGFRYEKTNMHLKAFNDSIGIIKTNDLLPSIALTYKVNDKTNLRASANRTLARPSFREFAPLATYDFLGGYIQNGNPDLQRTLVDNFDLRWEKYPKVGEYLSFSLFYKKFLNPIENAQSVRAGGSTSQFQFKNVKESNLYGAELEVRKSLDSFVDALKYFKLSANFTYVYSYVNVTPEELVAIRTWEPGAKDTRPMYNQAPYTLNGSLSYENPNNGWESTLSMNVSGKRLIVYQIDLPSIYLQPMPDLNFTLRKHLTKRFSVLFKVKNILDNTHKEQISLGDNVYYTTKYQLGRSYALSLSFNLNK
ncbi:MAG TPA: TonB-dependent receptor [Sunxiuqinia sp.]|nr:TonB-dependent receptor [Sunxiuqinia sp.]